MAANRKFQAITAAEFKALKGENPRVVKKDGTVAATGLVHDGLGLNLDVGKGSQRSWVYVYWFGGKRRETGFGSAHKVGLAEARAKREAAEKLVAAGVDPQERAKQDKAAAKAEADRTAALASAKSLADLAKEAVLHPICCNSQRADVRAGWVSMLQPHLTNGLTAKAPHELTPDLVAACVAAIRERGAHVQADRVLKALRNLYEWCAGKGYAPADSLNPCEFKGRNALKLEPYKRDHKEHPAIPFRQMGAFAARLRARAVTSCGLAVEWSILSASRTAEAAPARWEEINADATVWTVPEARMKIKGNGPHRVPLTDRHREILELLAPEGRPASGLMFPGQKSGQHVNKHSLTAYIKKVWPYMVPLRDGGEALASAHGTARTSFRTWAENQTAPGGGFKYEEKLMEMCIAHVVGGAARNTYVSEGNVEARRAIMEDWADYLSREESNVTVLRPLAA